MKIEAVIFDWAGTTVDYGSFAPVQAFVEAFKQFGIKPTVEEVREPMGMLKKKHISTMLEMPRIREAWMDQYKRNWTQEDVDAVYQASEKSILPILKNFVKPKPYVLECVRALRERGIKIGSTTGYTDAMMEIVALGAKEAGYEPDYYMTPNGVGNMGRPYPYMLYQNMQKLQISSIQAVLKVGDTVADIKEGKQAGCICVGVIEGSSIMGLAEEEYEALTVAKKALQCKRVQDIYTKCGADYTILNMSGLLDVIDIVNAQALHNG